jgi:mRNA turnover protein 4
MPKSKRSQVVSLTKVKPKGREHKEALVENIRKALEQYPHVYTFTVANMRTNILQACREERRADSRFFVGSNKVMGVALGRDAETSAAPNLWKLTRFLSGLSGLFFTTLDKKAVKAYFDSVAGNVFARTGGESTVSFQLKQGPLHQFPHSMLEHLRKLGLPVRLDNGVIVVEEDTIVCEPGEELTTEAAQLLRLFGLETAQFGITLTAHWTDGVARKIVNKGE